MAKTKGHWLCVNDEFQVSAHYFPLFRSNKICVYLIFLFICISAFRFPRCIADDERNEWRNTELETNSSSKPEQSNVFGARTAHELNEPCVCVCVAMARRRFTHKTIFERTCTMSQFICKEKQKKLLDSSASNSEMTPATSTMLPNNNSSSDGFDCIFLLLRILFIIGAAWIIAERQKSWKATHLRRIEMIYFCFI